MSDAELYDLIRHRINDARVLAGLTKTEMAERLKIGRVTYLDIERGRNKHIDVLLLYRIAQVTGRKLSFFLPESVEQDPVRGLEESMLQAFPDLEAPSVGEIVDFIRLVQRRDRSVRNAGSPGHGKSPDGNGHSSTTSSQTD